MNNTSDLSIQIGRKIRETRKELNLTQENVAERTGLDWSFIGQIERGTNTPSIRTLSKIAEALNLEIGDMFPAKVTKSKDELLLKEISKILNQRSPADKKFLIKLLKDICSHFGKKK
ncbi:MAG: helix-turn-helix transcriptional regulator [Elusimicrobia bacterium]|nr:helix-turn-helix transcriptional regulator [Elusimicrobiota bacterium]